MKKIILLLLLAGLSTDLDARIRVKAIYPINGTIKIKNVAGFTYDYTHFMLTVNGAYHHLSSLTIVKGNLNAGINEEMEFSGLNLPASASIGLWRPNSFPGNATSANLVDYMQYGSAGHDYENIAVLAGLWTAGEFVSGTPPYMHIGGPYDEGASFWQSSTIGLDNHALHTGMETFPNPMGEKLTILLPGHHNFEDLSISIIDINGRILKEVDLYNEKTQVNTANIAQGTYLLLLRNEAGILERKYVIRH